MFAPNGTGQASAPEIGEFASSQQTKPAPTRGIEHTSPLNDLVSEGLRLLPWWQDWRDETVAIIASGESIKSANIGLLRDRVRVVAIKESAVELCPWADVVYGCDWAWWRHRKGLPDFKGLKLAYDPKVRAQFPDVHLISIPEKGEKGDQILTDVPGQVGSGGNSGFQALNIAVQFGATRIIGIGFDMRGEHWYGRNNWPKGNNPGEFNFRRWRKAFDGAAPTLRSLGVEFINAAPNSTLKAYPKMSIDEALRRWGV